MKKDSEKQEDTDKTEKELIIAKIGYRNAIIIAIIGLIGTALTAYFGYLSNRPLDQVNQETPIISTLPSPPTQTFASPSLQPSPSPSAVQQINEVSQLPRDPATGFQVIYPSCNILYDLTDQKEFEPLIVRLRWGAKTAELAEMGAGSISYTLSINGEPVSDIEQYRKSAIFVQDSICEQDMPESWWVYWDYIISKAPGVEIRVFVSIVSLEELDNGWNLIPAGYEENFEKTIDLLSLFQVD